jgi:alkylhydroperoxidase family enzyme
MTQRIPPATPPYDELALKMFERLPKEWDPPFMMFRVLARDPRLLQRYINGAASYLEPNHVTIRQREVFLLRVTGLCRCEYEWGLRVHFFAEIAGLSEDQIQATVQASADTPTWTDEDRLLLRLAEELHQTCSISAELWASLTPIFTAEGILQLLMIAGHYRMTAYLGNSLKLPLEPGRARSFPPGIVPPQP